jgi:polar amino acid transport system permease protein
VTGPLELLEKPKVRRGLLLLVVAALVLPLDWAGVGQHLFGIDLPAWPAALIGAALVAAIVVANLAALARLPFAVQVPIVWLELGLLFLLFFLSFGLDLGFILSRLPGLAGFVRGEGAVLQGAVLALCICAVSITASTALALVAALSRLSRSGVAFGIATFYVSFFRGTPLLLQVLLIYLGLPQLGLVLSAIPAGMIALSLCYGAYMAEIFRAGIQGIPRGQWDGASSLGLSPGQTMRLVILPQAVRLIIPPTGNQFIAMLKDSSLVSVMGVWELMYLARNYGRAEFKYMEMLITAAVIYWLLSAVFELVQARLERRFGRSVGV